MKEIDDSDELDHDVALHSNESVEIYCIASLKSVQEMQDYAATCSSCYQKLELLENISASQSLDGFGAHITQISNVIKMKN